MEIVVLESWINEALAQKDFARANKLLDLYGVLQGWWTMELHNHIHFVNTYNGSFTN